MLLFNCGDQVTLSTYIILYFFRLVFFLLFPLSCILCGYAVETLDSVTVWRLDVDLEVDYSGFADTII